MKADTDNENRRVYVSKNENEKMLLKAQERLGQTPRCKRNLNMKHNLMSRWKAVLDVYSGMTTKMDKDTREAYSKL